MAFLWINNLDSILNLIFLMHFQGRYSKDVILHSRFAVVIHPIFYETHNVLTSHILDELNKIFRQKI